MVSLFVLWRSNSSYSRGYLIWMLFEPSGLVVKSQYINSFFLITINSKLQCRTLWLRQNPLALSISGGRQLTGRTIISSVKNLLQWKVENWSKNYLFLVMKSKSLISLIGLIMKPIRLLLFVVSRFITNLKLIYSRFLAINSRKLCRMSRNHFGVISWNLKRKPW